MATKKTKKRPGRKPTLPENLSSRWNIRATPEHRERFEELAAADGRSLSAWSYRQLCAAAGLVPEPGAP